MPIYASTTTDKSVRSCSEMVPGSCFCVCSVPTRAAESPLRKLETRRRCSAELALKSIAPNIKLPTKKHFRLPGKTSQGAIFFRSGFGPGRKRQLFLKIGSGPGELLVRIRKAKRSGSAMMVKLPRDRKADASLRHGKNHGAAELALGFLRSTRTDAGRHLKKLRRRWIYAKRRRDHYCLRNTYAGRNQSPECFHSSPVGEGISHSSVHDPTSNAGLQRIRPIASSAAAEQARRKNKNCASAFLPLIYLFRRSCHGA